MKTNRIFRIVAIFFILSLNISCDQISKSIVRHKMDYYEQISLVYNHLTLTKVENTGAFLSLGNAFPKMIKLFVMIILPIIVLILAVIFLLTRSNLSYLKIIGICSMVGGGFGNIYDRIIYGSVTDFLHIDFILFKTGIFNMADVSIMVGMFLMIADYYVNRKNKELVPYNS
jgi:signal peptidase II